MTEVIIGVDLGGTRIRAARLDPHLHIVERHETLTRAAEGLEPTVERIKDMIRGVWPKDDANVAGIGISAPGPLNPATGVVVAPPNLAGWHNVPLGDTLLEAFDVPVFVGNDANVAALAETARGAAQGYRHVVFITVSTGIGGGVVIDGRLLLGEAGLAAEAGHIIMICEDGRVSTLEKEAAGPALARQARARIAEGEQSVVLSMAGNDPDKIDAVMVGRAAERGDSLALDIVRRAGTVVGLGMVSLLHLFNPQILVFGGGVTNIGEPLFGPLRKAIEQYSIDEAYWRDLKIEPAALGDDVSIIGAAALVITGGGQSDVTDVASRIQT